MWLCSLCSRSCMPRWLAAPATHTQALTAFPLSLHACNSRLAGIETVPSAGLPAEYWNTPSKYISYAFIAFTGLMAASIFLAHH